MGMGKDRSETALGDRGSEEKTGCRVRNILSIVPTTGCVVLVLYSTTPGCG